MTGYELGLGVAGSNIGSGVAQGHDEVRLLGRHGLDVIGLVVGRVAREVAASRHERLGKGRELGSRVHLLDTILVIAVDDG